MLRRYLSLLKSIKEKHGRYKHLIDDVVALNYLVAKDALEINSNGFVSIKKHGEELLDKRCFEEEIEKIRREKRMYHAATAAWIVTLLGIIVTALTSWFSIRPIQIVFSLFK